MTRSGRFVLRTSKELHENLAREAKRRGVSLNSLVVSKLSESETQREYAFLDGLKFVPDGLLRYGSTVRGEQTSASDIDWLLIVPPQIEINRALYTKVDEVNLPDPKISLHLAHLPADLDDLSNFWLELALEAEILLDPSKQVRCVLMDIRKAIASGAYRRHLTHGQPYWAKRGKDAKSEIG